MIRLDTHAVVWLAGGEWARFSAQGLVSVEEEDLVVSPLVELEITYLHESGRLSAGGLSVMADLRERIGLRVSSQSLASVVAAAHGLSWTRDPFDRLIVADAMAADCPLLTKDRTITEHCTLARW